MATSKEIFEQYEHTAGTCTKQASVTATSVKKGDSIIIDCGFLAESTAEEDGWSVNDKEFYTNSEFKEAFQQTTPQTKNAQALPEQASVNTYKKGDTVLVDLGGIYAESSAEDDGYTVNASGESKNYGAVEFHETWKHDDIPVETGLSGRFNKISDKQVDSTTYNYIVLSKDTVFDFEGEDEQYTAPAGNILYENPNDIDGYTVTSPSDFLSKYKIEQAVKTETPKNTAKKVQKTP